MNLEAQRQAVIATATERQNQATLPERSVWVAASAGTGKTSVLTRRVLRLLVAGTAPHRILCITYTKAAAAEMLKRLMETLGEWASLPLPVLISALTRLAGGRAPKEEEVRRARQLFGLVLESPGGLKIQTIHSFCQSILSRFPLEAGLSPHFQAMDDVSAAELLLDAREQVLAAGREEGEGGALKAALKTVADRISKEGFQQILKTLLVERGLWMRRFDSTPSLEARIAALAIKLAVDPTVSPDALWRAAYRDALSQPGCLRAAAKALEGGTGKTDKAAAGVLARFVAEGLPSDFEAYRRVFLTQKEGLPRASLCTKSVKEAAPEVAEWMAEEAERLQRVQERVRQAEIFTGSAALIRLGAAILEVYADMKRRRAWLDYDDLILYTVRLLARDGGVSWVMFKLDGGLEHILIDEAQDTNPDQWQIVRLLTQEFFMEQSRGEGGRTVFVVGDVKQSIYSFQGADPRAFHTMRQLFSELLAKTGQPLLVESLDHSFRSTAAVLETVDRVFEPSEAAAGVLEGNQSLRHEVSRLGEAGLVELWPTLAKRIPDDPEGDWRLPSTREGASNPPAVVARVIARRIRSWLDQGEILTARGRPVRAGDILILVRRREQFVAELVRALKQEAVPVAGADRLRLTAHLAVMDLLVLGRFLLLPSDDLSLACLLKSPLLGMDEESLFLAARNRDGQSLWQALCARSGAYPALRTAEEKLNRWRAKAEFIRPYEFYARILGEEGGRKAFLERLGAEAADPIDEFLNQALAFERIHTPSLQGFIHWLDCSDQEIKRDSDTAGRDEVRIMTVHGAKGLQSPIVFLPDCASIPKSRRTLFWPEESAWGPIWSLRKEGDDPVAKALRAAEDEKEKAEYRRLLYVALTRAEDRLYATGWLGARETAAKGGSWHALLQTALDALTAKGRAASLDLDFTADGAPEWRGKGVRFATAQHAPTEDQTRGAAAPAARAALPVWFLTPPPKEPQPGKPLTPSRLVEDPPARSPLLGQESGDPELGVWSGGMKRGRLLHRLLQMLPGLPPERWAESASLYLGRAIHDLSPDECGSLWREAESVLTHPDLAPLFGSTARAEVPLVGRVGEIIVSGQIDRLWVGASEVLIADFKTNRPPPKVETGVSRAYRQQMALYRALLRQVYPDRPVRCWLIWTDGARVMPLSDAMLDDPSLLTLSQGREIWR